MQTRLRNGLGGDLDRMVHCAKLMGFVNCTRSAVGIGSLPFGIAVEVEGIFEVRA